ncbi:zinc ribbon domain-containing protein [Selenomonas ruminantium]|uniref:zinc ribbon domain-containing protein n=1 Tax=Selenomonas ruminantium TaxID=971 RepID=UPI0026EFBA39|nr:zinc ribbon domain-containing protein [Selenomonas ruminantium]
MKNKDIYTVYEETPMAFYKFIMFSLIIGLLLRTITLIGSFLDATYDFSFWYTLIFSIIQLGLTIVGLIGLSQMKWYGPLCYMANFGLLILDAIAMLAISIYYGSRQEGTALGSMIGTLVWLIPIWIYFRHRRLLFSPPPADDPRVSVPQKPLPMSEDYPPTSEKSDMVADYDNPPTPPGSIQYVSQPIYSNSFSANSTYPQSTWNQPKEQPPVMFCRKCGRKLLPDSAFCSYCGASTEV